MQSLKNLDFYDEDEFHDGVSPLRYDPDLGPQFASARVACSGSSVKPAFVALMVSLAATVVGLEVVAWSLQ